MKRSIERFLRQFRRKAEECTPAPLPTPEFDPATMDIAEVLRRPMRRSSTAIVQEFSDGTQKLFDPTRLAAADEIERLRKVVASPELGSVVNLVVDSSKIECGRISPIRSVV